MSALIKFWRKLWVRWSGPRGFGTVASWLAAWRTTPLYGRAQLSKLHRRGYVAPSVRVPRGTLKLGDWTYVGDRVYAFDGGGEAGIELADRAFLYGDTIIHTGQGGGIRIGERSHVHPGCTLAAYVEDVVIGADVEIAARSAIYSSNHAVDPGELISQQEVVSKGPVRIGDGCWLGQNVIVLSGVTIGPGAVIGAGSVVIGDVPANAIAVGNPARVVKYREPGGEKTPAAAEDGQGS